MFCRSDRRDVIAIPAIAKRDGERMLTLQDLRDVGRRHRLDARDAGQALGHELVKVLVGSKAGRGEQIRPARREPEKEDLRQFGQALRDRLDIAQADLQLDVDVIGVTDLEGIGPGADLDDLVADHAFDALADCALRHAKLPGDSHIAPPSVSTELCDDSRIERVDLKHNSYLEG